MKKPKEKKIIICKICGDSGKVRRSYIEPLIGCIAGKQLVDCPKCRGVKK